MYRPLVVVALLIAALFVVPSANAQCMMSRAGAPTLAELRDVGGGAAGVDLDEWSVLFHDLRTPGCYSDELFDAFTKKLRAQITARHPDIPRELHNNDSHSGFRGFLSGGVVSFAYGTGLALGGSDKLTEEIDALLGAMPWADSISGNCGFVGFDQDTQQQRWKRGDNCMDDFALAAAGHAWRGAYFKKTGRARWTQERSAAYAYIDAALKDTERSICIYDPDAGVLGPGGPCNSTIAKLRQSLATGDTIHIVPLNHTMENYNYGLGLLTSIAHAFVALEEMGENPRARYANDLDAQTVLTALFQQAQHSATPDGGNDVDKCYRPSVEAPDTRNTRLTEDDFKYPEGRREPCEDRSNRLYQPALYPIKDFYQANGFTTGAAAGDFQFDIEGFKKVEGQFFVDHETGVPKVVTFLGSARYDIYKNVAWGWWADRNSRPDFDFTFAGSDCLKPDATISISRFGQPIDVRVYATEKNITASVPPQPPNSTISWAIFNASHPNNHEGGFSAEGQSVTFDAPCVADEHATSPKGLIQVTVNVTTPPNGLCNTTQTDSQNFLITVEQPNSLIAGASTTINRGRSYFIPVYLNGVGPWKLKWSDGFEETVVPNNSNRPYFHSRTVTPDFTTTYRITEMNQVGCESKNAGMEFGSVTVGVVDEGAATPVIIVDQVFASAGQQTLFKARMSTVAGGYVPGAKLTFYAFGKKIGEGFTDANGRAQVFGVVDYPPDSYGYVINVVFEGDEAIKPGTGTGPLTIICYDSITVAPTQLNVPADAKDYTIIVSGSKHCDWTPQSTDPSWLTTINPAVTKGNGTFIIRVTQLPPGTSRRAYVHVGSKLIEVFQSSDCSYKFNPQVAYLNADNDFQAVSSMDVVAATGCEWKARSAASWIQLVKENPESKTNPFAPKWLNVDELDDADGSTVHFRVSTNTGNARTGRINLFDGSGTTLKAHGSVNQYEPPPCSPPVLLGTSQGYNVRNGQTISYYAAFTGTNLKYRIFKNGLPWVDSGQSIVIRQRWTGDYPSRGQSVSFFIIAFNDCGDARSAEESFTNVTPDGDSCLVPDIASQPGLHSSPRPGSNVTLDIGVTGPQGQWPDESFKYQWYRGLPGDFDNKIDGATGPSLTTAVQISCRPVGALPKVITI